jgi:D-cysteine desulfhydrase
MPNEVELQTTISANAPRLGRLRRAHLPTPLEQPRRLAEAMGIDLWVKRDDATGGPEAGNKIRKLEFLLAAATEQGCDTVVTCGGVQSNHARASAVLAAWLGMGSLLLLRAPTLHDDASDDPLPGVPLCHEHAPLVGNVLLDRLVGADVRLITAASYERRDELMAEAAASLAAGGAKPYVIPEGGSNGLGALGYVEAMAEIRRQLDSGAAGGAPFDVVVHACGSGGTAAGCALGARQYHVADRVCAMAVASDATTFERRIAGIIAEAQTLDERLGGPASWTVDDRAKGPAYAVATKQQRQLIVDVARLSGLVLDPVYTGKAMAGLWAQCHDGELRGARVLFIHTGGLPGLLAQTDAFTDLL